MSNSSVGLCILPGTEQKSALSHKELLALRTGGIAFGTPTVKKPEWPQYQSAGERIRRLAVIRAAAVSPKVLGAEQQAAILGEVRRLCESS